MQRVFVIRSKNAKNAVKKLINYFCVILMDKNVFFLKSVTK